MPETAGRRNIPISWTPQAAQSQYCTMYMVYRKKSAESIAGKTFARSNGKFRPKGALAVALLGARGCVAALSSNGEVVKSSMLTALSATYLGRMGQAALICSSSRTPVVHDGNRGIVDSVTASNAREACF